MVADREGITRPVRVRGEVPLVIRTVAGADGSLTAYLVGGAAGPLGGDDVSLTVEVGAGARLRVRSAAASMALPGPHGHRSNASVEVTVAIGGELDWWPEPIVSADGSDHAMRTTIRLAGGASLRWVDEVVLGRHGERGGRLTSRQRVEVDGVALIDHELAVGAAHLDGPGANGPFRAFATALLHGHGAPDGARPVVEPDLRAASMSLGPLTRLAMAMAMDRDRAAAAVGTDANRWRALLTCS